MKTASSAQTAYEILGVDPCAPAELLATVYWMAASELQVDRAAGKPVDTQLYAVTQAYETISSPERRARYDELIGNREHPVIVRKLGEPRRTLRSRLLRRRPVPKHVDYYEIIGLDPNISSPRFDEIYSVMRNHYLKAPSGRQRRLLVSLLDDALSTLSDEQLRAEYDKKRSRRRGDSNGVSETVVPAPKSQASHRDDPAAVARSAPVQQARVPEPPARLEQAASKTSGSAGSAVGSTVRGVARSLAAAGRALISALQYIVRLVRSGVSKLSERASREDDTALAQSRVEHAPSRREHHEPIVHRRKAEEEVEQALLERLAVRVDEDAAHSDRPAS